VDMVNSWDFVESISRFLEMEFDCIDTANFEFIFCGAQIKEHHTRNYFALDAKRVGPDFDFSGGIGGGRVGFMLLTGITTRWRRPGMPRDLHVMELFCYLGQLEL